MATEEEAAAGGEGAEEHAWHRDWKYITFDSSLRRVRRQNKSSIRKSDFNGYVVQLLRLPAFSVGRNSGYYVRASLSLFDATTNEFHGRTCSGPAVELKDDTELNHEAYVLSATMTDSRRILVGEVTLMESDEQGGTKERPIGWFYIKASELLCRKGVPREVHLLDGTPRVLMLEQSRRKIPAPFTGTRVEVSMDLHPMLIDASHLLPPEELITHGDFVPGLMRFDPMTLRPTMAAEGVISSAASPQLVPHRRVQIRSIAFVGSSSHWLHGEGNQELPKARLYVHNTWRKLLMQGSELDELYEERTVDLQSNGESYVMSAGDEQEEREDKGRTLSAMVFDPVPQDAYVAIVVELVLSPGSSQERLLMGSVLTPFVGIGDGTCREQTNVQAPMSTIGGRWVGSKPLAPPESLEGAHVSCLLDLSFGESKAGLESAKGEEEAELEQGIAEGDEEGVPEQEQREFEEEEGAAAAYEEESPAEGLAEEAPDQQPPQDTVYPVGQSEAGRPKQQKGKQREGSKRQRSLLGRIFGGKQRRPDEEQKEHEEPVPEEFQGQPESSDDHHFHPQGVKRGDHEGVSAEEYDSALADTTTAETGGEKTSVPSGLSHDEWWLRPPSADKGHPKADVGYSEPEAEGELALSPKGKERKVEMKAEAAPLGTYGTGEGEEDAPGRKIPDVAMQPARREDSALLFEKGARMAEEIERMQRVGEEGVCVQLLGLKGCPVGWDQLEVLFPDPVEGKISSSGIASLEEAQEHQQVVQALWQEHANTVGLNCVIPLPHKGEARQLGIRNMMTKPLCLDVIDASSGLHVGWSEVTLADALNNKARAVDYHVPVRDPEAFFQRGADGGMNEVARLVVRVSVNIEKGIAATSAKRRIRKGKSKSVRVRPTIPGQPEGVTMEDMEQANGQKLRRYEAMQMDAEVGRPSVKDMVLRDISNARARRKGARLKELAMRGGESASQSEHEGNIVGLVPGRPSLIERRIVNPYDKEVIFFVRAKTPVLRPVESEEEWDSLGREEGSKCTSNRKNSEGLPLAGDKLYLRPHESVVVPFRALSLAGSKEAVVEQLEEGATTTISVEESETGTIAAQLVVRFSPMGPLPTRVVRLHVGEGEKAGATLACPQWAEKFGSRMMMRASEGWVACSWHGDTGVMRLRCRKALRAGESSEFFVHALTGPGSSVNHETWLVRLFGWRRVSIRARLGEEVKATIPIGGGSTSAGERVVMRTSKPSVIKLEPTSVVLPPPGESPVNVHVSFAPRHTGTSRALCHCVMASGFGADRGGKGGQVAQGFLVEAEAEAPAATATFTARFDPSAHADKRLPFRNPYNERREFTVEALEPELVEPMRDRIAVEAGGTVELCVRLLDGEKKWGPAGRQRDVWIFLKDEEGLLEEAFLIRVLVAPSSFSR